MTVPPSKVTIMSRLQSSHGIWNRQPAVSEPRRLVSAPHHGHWHSKRMEPSYQASQVSRPEPTLAGLARSARLGVLVEPRAARFVADLDRDVGVGDLGLTREARGRAHVEGLVEDVFLFLELLGERREPLLDVDVAGRARAYAAARVADLGTGALGGLQDGRAALDLDADRRLVGAAEEGDARHQRPPGGRSAACWARRSCASVPLACSTAFSTSPTW